MKRSQQNTVEGTQTFKSVSPGEHEVRFLFVEEAEGLPEFGPAVRWVFEVLSGPDKGRRVSTLTGRKFSPSTAAGRLLSQLLGRPLSGGTVDFEQLEGSQHIAVVVSSGTGTKVSEVRPLQASTEDEDSAGDVLF